MIQLDLMLAVGTHYRLELGEIKRLQPRGHLHVQKGKLLTIVVQAGMQELCYWYSQHPQHQELRIVP